jgi:hypothetical protein
VNEHVGGVVEDPAACVTVTVTPATVRVPILDCVVVLAATVKPNVPLPVLVKFPKETVIHDTLLTAVQVQVPELTVTEIGKKSCPVGFAVKVVWAT